MNKISKIRFKGYSEEVRRKLLKQLVKLDGRIGFRGYTKQDIVERSNGILAYSPTNILNNKIVNGKNDTYISQAKYEESPEIMVKKNNILFVKTGSTLGKSSIVRELTEPATINPQLIVIKTLHVDSDYLAVYLLTDSIQKQIFQSKIGGAVPTLTETEIGKFIISLPSLAEQSAIGSLFRTLDDLLSNYKDNLANFQSLKATMLSKMFPKAGQTVPEIRLDGFEGEWEKLKLRDVVHTNPKSELPENFKYIDLESVVGTRINKIREERKISAPSRAQRLAKKGDVFYQTVRPYQKNNYLFKLDEIDYVFSTGYAQLRPIFNRCDSDFLLILLQNSRFLSNVLDRCTGTSYPAINVNDLIEILIAIPSYEEQQAIGSYFSNLDNLINSHQEKITQLETLRKKLLQDMFI